MTMAEVVGALPSGRSRSELLAATLSGLGSVPLEAVVVVALSGGPDSTALAFLVAEARPDLAIELVHVRHGLRDDGADLAAVITTSRYLGAELKVVDVVVEPAGKGVEAAARDQRHAALRRVAASVRAKAILLGHSADDQAETVLLRLTRGTGPGGLAGMAVHDGDLCRPLLRLRRADLHAFVANEGLVTTTDPTNNDQSLTRNRLRLTVMGPLSGLGPDVVGAINRLAQLTRDDVAWLEEATDVLAADHLRRVGPVVSVQRELIDAQPVAAARRLVRRMVLAVRPDQPPPTASEVEGVRSLQRGAIDIPGAEAVVAGGWLTLAPIDLARPAHVDLVIDGRTAWPAADWLLETTTEHASLASSGQLGLLAAWRPPRVNVPESLVVPGGSREYGQVVLGGLGEVLPRITVRPRRPGDRVDTAAGGRKLQDVFVDAGVPRPVRDLVPLVATDDRILWVPGLVADEAALRTGRGVPQLHIAVRRLR